MVATLVTKNYKTASVFKKYEIDFCCEGKITIEDACLKKEINPNNLIQDLEFALKEEKQESGTENLELDLLVDHILNVHHSYINRRSSEIDPFVNKLVRVHGDRHPELQQILVLFEALKNDLMGHMQKEENVLFPYIKNMIQAKKNNQQLETPFFGTIQNPIRMMEQEHVIAGDQVKQIRELSQGFIPPEDACNTYRVTFAMLKEFEEDLHRHVHLENNILYPKAIQLEQSF